MEDPELTMAEKTAIMIQNLYQDLPENMELAAKMATKFLNGGSDSEEETSDIRVYSFSKDANLIYAAFRQTHGIDLSTASLHWFEFLALFMDLGSETTFCSLVSLRKRVKTGKATKDERAAAREMGDVFDIPEIDTRTLEEKDMEREFMRKLGMEA